MPADRCDSAIRTEALVDELAREMHAGLGHHGVGDVVLRLSASLHRAIITWGRVRESCVVSSRHPIGHLRRSRQH